jgi:nitrate reductase delta subunit
MSIYSLLSQAFSYPSPGLLADLQAGLKNEHRSAARDQLASFLKHVEKLSLGEWEELSTRTLDLSPAAAPYIGFQIWGESYQRGEFMSKINHELAQLGIDTEGELPDHLAPVLLYLEAAREPIQPLLENFEPAVGRMTSVLREKDKHNPYIHLFEAALAAFREQRVKT